MIVSIDYDSFNEESIIETKKLSELDANSLKDLMEYCMHQLDFKDPKLKKELLSKHKFYDLNHIKSEKGIQVSNMDAIYVRSHSGLIELTKNSQIDEKQFQFMTYRNMNSVGPFYIEISCPDWIKVQVEQYNAKIVEDREKREQAKLQRKINKAKKLLKSIEDKKNGTCSSL